MNKITLLLCLLLGSSYSFAQDTSITADHPKLALLKARQMMVKGNNYNPQKAFATYLHYAERGDAAAMNGLANLYNRGLGTQTNETEALKWYEEAANAGYTNAWYNLGSMYKAGIGTAQSFEKAYQAFCRGAALGSGVCHYAKGYMLYKGFGTVQNYQLAFAEFKNGANVRDIASSYMLGLCFRNGYGVTKNLDSAQLYLEYAANKGDGRAASELKTLQPENIHVQPTDLPQPPPEKATPLSLNQGFKKITQNFSKNTAVAGNYQGYLIKFDWSGKHIIGQSTLNLNLTQDNESLTGQWEEEGQEPIYITAKITDTAVLFSQTQQAQTDHYHSKNKLLVKFEDSKLHLVQSQDTIYLSGNLNSYSPKAKEPEKPRLMMLVRTGAASNSLNLGADTSQAAMAEEDRLDALALQFIAYPNPFNTSTNLKYTLRRPATVSILITDVLTGRTVYRSQQGLQQAGLYTIPLSLYERAGNYVVSLQYNNKLKSLIVFKN